MSDNPTIKPNVPCQYAFDAGVLLGIMVGAGLSALFIPLFW